MCSCDLPVYLNAPHRAWEGGCAGKSGVRQSPVRGRGRPFVCRASADHTCGGRPVWDSIRPFAGSDGQVGRNRRLGSSVAPTKPRRLLKTSPHMNSHRVPHQEVRSCGTAQSYQS